MITSPSPMPLPRGFLCGHCDGIAHDPRGPFTCCGCLRTIPRSTPEQLTALRHETGEALNRYVERRRAR